MCQALCQASSKRTLPLNVHASGRRTRAGGWQRAWGLGAEKGRSDLVGQGAGEGSSAEVPRAGPGRRGYRCPLSSPLVADISRMVPGAQALPASPWGPPPRPPARFLLPLGTLCTSSSGPASSLSALLATIHSCPDPLTSVSSSPRLDGNSGAQASFLNVTCQNSNGGRRTQSCAPPTQVEMNE